MSTKYIFDDKFKGDDAAGEVYTQLNDMGFATKFENVQGHAHQNYLVFPKGTRALLEGNEIMRFEYNGIAEPAYVEFNFGTSKDAPIFERLATDAARKHGGVVSTEVQK